MRYVQRRFSIGILLLYGLLSGPGADAGIVVGFTKQFMPDEIGPGSVSTLRFTITNPFESGLSDLAFVDTLPSDVKIASPANAASDCGAPLLDAPPGGGVISFSGGSLGQLSSCSVSVDVTSDVAGTHTNTSDPLTWDGDTGGIAVDDLIVDSQRPGFGKSFSPNPVVAGDVSTLTLTIDNTQNDSDVNFLSFVDNLPAGLVVASPANASTDCDHLQIPTVTAVPGTSVVGLSNGGVASGTSCTVVVDVATQTAGLKHNVTGDLISGFSALNSGKASATLDVELGFLRKLFTDDPVAPGGTVNLEFTITNFDRDKSVTDITFTDDLGAALTGLAATGLPLANPCGNGSQLSGSGVIALTDGALAPEASCTFSVELDVPGGAAPGMYVNTTSSVTTMVDGEVVIQGPASDDLIVAPVPVFTKEFTNDPVSAGDDVTLEFTIENTDANNSLTGVNFLDELTTFLPFPVAATLPANGFCGASSTISLISIGIEEQALSVSGVEMAPAGNSGDTCTFAVVLSIPVVQPTSTYVNVTTDLSGAIGGTPIAASPATDTLEVVAAPSLRKQFTDDPVLPGDTVTLEFTLDLDQNSPGDATDIEFTDDLDAVISGLQAIDLPINDVCGSGSQLSGTSLLTFTGGSLAPGTSCTFSTTLQVPTGLIPGDNPNVTSTVTAMSLGLAVASGVATDDLTIAGIDFTKEFLNDPVVAGSVVSLQFDIANLSSTETVTNIQFSDSLSAVLSGLLATNLPLNDICGNGSSLVGQSGNTLLSFTGGSLAPGTSCSFAADLQVPFAADSGDYVNTTSTLVANFGAPVVFVDPASDDLSVFEPLSLQKLFLDDPVPPGASVDLEFTITNLDTNLAATDLTFTDDLDAALSGLAATNLPINDVCGAGSQISGTSIVSLTGGSLAAGDSCSFSISLDVPANAAAPSTAINTTTDITGKVGGIDTSGAPAQDDLSIEEIECTALDGEAVVLQDQTIDDLLTIEVCDRVDVGPNLTVIGPNGKLTIRAGNAVVFFDGTTFAVDSELEAGLDPSLVP